MKLRMMLNRLCATPRFAGVWLLVIAPASACIQGHRFSPAKPTPPPPGVSIAAVDMSALRFEAPPLEPLKIDLLVPRAPAVATAAPESVSASAGETAERRAVFAGYVRAFESDQAETKLFSDRLDYAVALIHLGRTADAIGVLEALEAEQPGRYETAANLGTAHELAGNLEQALRWIARGIERNPAAHAGTEWLHVAILQAKVQLRQNPEWLRRHSVLDGHEKRDNHLIVRAIEYQLGERLQFVKPQDPVVCDLFYQAAARVTGEGAVARRAQFAQESLRFGDWRKRQIAALPKT